jgi:hypothetical protein
VSVNASTNLPYTTLLDATPRGEGSGELGGEFGGLGHAAEVTAGKVDHRSVEQPAEFDGRFAAWVAVRVAPGRWNDPVGGGTQPIQVEVGGGVLA